MFGALGQEAGFDVCLGDYAWRDNDAQEELEKSPELFFLCQERFETWEEQLKLLAKERSLEFKPLRVALLEIGAGGNVSALELLEDVSLKVRTVRERSESILKAPCRQPFL